MPPRGAVICSPVLGPTGQTLSREVPFLVVSMKVGTHRSQWLKIGFLDRAQPDFGHDGSLARPA